MLDDNVPWAAIVRSGRTAIFHFGHSPELGERVWESGDVSGNPIPPSPHQTAMGDRIRSLFRRPRAFASGSAAGS
jgi:hypothetical protein